jgi:lipopolysaccharide transport system permease protein
MRAVVRTHGPALARPVEFVRSIGHDLRRSRRLAAEIGKRDIRRQYREALFGPAAVLLTPLVMTGVALGFRRTGILNVTSESTPYALFVLTGVILWITFVDAMYAPIYGLLADQRLVARANAPPEAIVLGKFGPQLVNLLARATLLVLALLGYGMQIPATALLAPIGVLTLAALGTAFGLLIAPINLIYRDLAAVLGTVTTLWFFFSPVYFPAPSSGPIGALMDLNPITPILSDTRSMILAGTLPGVWHSVLIVFGTLLFLVVSWFYTRVVLSVAIEQGNE